MSLRDNLQRNAAEALHVREPAEIGVDGVVSEAIRVMQDKASGCVVVTKDRTPVGILTERDILTKVLAGGLSGDTPIEDVMTRSVDVIREGSSVGTIIKRMHEGGFRHMPVVDSSGQLRGVVSIKRIVEYLVEHFPSAVFNLPPDPAQRQLAREGA